MDPFSLQDKVCVVIGGSGVLGGAIAREYARRGAKVAIVGRSEEKLQKQVDRAHSEGQKLFGVTADACTMDSMEQAAVLIEAELGQPEVLVNAAGGNIPEATAGQDYSFFNIDVDALRKVVELNFFGGVIIPSQVFGKRMMRGEKGCIINIASMASVRPLTRVVGYSAAKAAVSNFTQWLAVHLILDCQRDIRVNAIAPGFFLTAQNEALLMDGEKLSKRGEQIIAHTPMGRFGDPEDLVGAAVWLASDASAFVTGTVIPIDGGFSAYSGV